MIINGKQVKNIFHNGKQVQKVIRNGVTLYSGQHPNMVGRWSARGKTNSDADRDILKDLSGNGRDIALKNFAFTINSGYENPLYPDGVVFDGVDDYGMNNKFNCYASDFTMIAKFQYLSTPALNNGSIAFNINGTPRLFYYDFWMTSGNKAVIGTTINDMVSKDGIVYMTASLYNGKPVTGKSTILTNVKNTFEVLRNIKGVLYDFILYDRTLTEQEIQSEILKYNL